MDGLKPYTAYRDSGVPWLGEVPAHWEVVKLKTVAARTQNGSTPPTDSPHYYSDEGLPWFGPSSLGASLTMGRPTRYVSDLAIRDGKVRPIVPPALAVSVIGNVGRSALMVEPGTTNQQITCFELLEQRVNARFVGYQFRLVESALAAGASSATIAILDASELRSTRLAIPATMAEQEAIVRFLDHYDRRAWRYVAAKKKLIALLNEEKQAIINRAVTRGLDPDVRLKPSGIDWLGDVPEHWKVRRLKYVVTPMEQGWSPQCDAQPAADDEWGVLKVGCVNGNSFDAAQNKKLPSGLQPVSALEITDGDILVSRANTRELLGLAALATAPRHRLILCDKLFRFRARADKADPAFLVHSIRGKTSRAQIESSTNGASDSMQNIGQSVVRNLFVSMPPIEEQKAIVVAIAEQTQSIQASVTRAERQIALMREYRTRLIADVVTGKLDVREAAANLPDEPEDLEPIEQGDTLSESGSEDDRAESEGTIEDGP